MLFFLFADMCNVYLIVVIRAWEAIRMNAGYGILNMSMIDYGS